MSIETEFQSTIQNVQNAYNGLNNLGATIPQNKTIENIKSCLDEIYDNLPKTEYQEGTEVNLGKTLKGKLDFEDGIVGIGDTYQYSTQGINLFYINKADDNRTWNGVTIKSTKTGPLCSRACLIAGSISSAFLPRVDTISPSSKKASETSIAAVKYPPGLLRTSTT